MKAPCVHHWIVERPAGEWSAAVCKFCKARSRFSNMAAEPEVSKNRIKLTPKRGGNSVFDRHGGTS